MPTTTCIGCTRGAASLTFVLKTRPFLFLFKHISNNDVGKNVFSHVFDDVHLANKDIK